MPIPDRLVALTFDDGPKSQATFAAPLLKECGFHATFYITEGLRFLIDKERYMTWEEAAALDRDGFEIGNHTRHHKDVTAQSTAELRADIDHIDQRCAEYGIAGQVTGVVGVLGPKRMDYGRNIPAVQFLSNLMSQVVGEVYK